MSSVKVVSMYATALVFLMLVLMETGAIPRPQQFPIDTPAFLNPDTVHCTAETANLCQQCAKRTESGVVYPWCCSNHEGTQEWCQHYLNFGLR